MRILITNDDGIHSPGLLTLARAASRFGDVRIVAPHVEQSSMGHAITSARPLSWRKTVVESFEAYRVDGTPADCVALGASQWDGVNTVLSGINLGPNLGNAMWHSGTLAGAKQAALLGLRGIALSTSMIGEDPAPGHLEPFLSQVLELLLHAEADLPLVNVNFPREPKGIMWTRQAVRHYDGHVVPGQDPMGRRHFWFIVKPIEQVEEGTDLWAVQRGMVSMTPLRLDLTDHARLAEARARHPREGDAPRS
ncbi:MAG: 5'/3'-nucleotidase SurE [Phycisphaerales bacterium]|nr:5'/3'-nucleotidase SurE [Phycisphaerales bacterium]